MEEKDKKGNLRGSIWKKLLIIAGWLMVWQIASRLAANPIFFAGPADVIKEFIKMAGSRDFMLSAINSLLRITGGFAVAFLLACFFGAAAYRFHLLEEILKPFVSFIKAVPVASVVVLLLIWFGAKYLSLYVTFMVVFPNIYINILTGLKSTDKDLLEMAEVFRLSFLKKLLYIYRPSVMPYLLGGARVSVGMSFKSGVAAEIIGLPAASIGEGLYDAKIYLNTAGVFVWTVVIIILSLLVEWLVIWLLKQASRQDKALILRVGVKDVQTEKKAGAAKSGKGICRQMFLELRNVSVAFGKNKVLDRINLSFSGNKIWCIMGASGRGKTTLLRVCAGIQKVQEGKVAWSTASSDAALEEEAASPGEQSGKKPASKEKKEGLDRSWNPRIGMAFQEDRLCMELSALNNVLLAADEAYSKEDIIRLLCEILPEKALYQPAKQLSGGMKRRLSVARAVLSDAQFLLLDEPFAGLDEENHDHLCRWLLKNRNGRPLLVATHDEEDAARLGAKVLRL